MPLFKPYQDQNMLRLYYFNLRFIKRTRLRPKRFVTQILKKITLIFMLAIPFLNLPSCSGKQVVTKYYVISGLDETLAYNTESPAANINAYAEIAPFQMSKAYDDNRIALRVQSNQLTYYYYHKWAENPAASVRNLVGRQLKTAGIFKDVQKQILGRKADYIVSGSIHSLERVWGEDDTAAHFSATFILFDNEKREIVVEYFFNRSVNLKNRNSMNEFAKIVSNILREETENFVEKMKNKL
jgi:ABC-type uncharacterized transport system auxiliary subunit